MATTGWCKADGATGAENQGYFRVSHAHVDVHGAWSDHVQSW